MPESKGESNLYYCEACDSYLRVILVDDGTTPFMLRCRATPNCTGMSRSQFYPSPPIPAFDQAGRVVPSEPTYEFYRPKAKARMSRGEREHVKMGGLLLRRRKVTEVAGG